MGKELLHFHLLTAYLRAQTALLALECPGLPGQSLSLSSSLPKAEDILDLPSRRLSSESQGLSGSSTWPSWQH